MSRLARDNPLTADSPGPCGSQEVPVQRDTFIYDTINSRTNIDFSSKFRACVSGFLLAPHPLLPP